MFSQEVKRIYDNARDISIQTGKPLDTSTILLAMFAVPCTASSILLDAAIDDGRVLDALPRVRPESAGLVEVIFNLASKISDNIASPNTSSVHLLMAISRTAQSRAALVIEACGVPMFRLRTDLMAHLTDPRLRQAANDKMIKSIGVQNVSPVPAFPNAPRASSVAPFFPKPVREPAGQAVAQTPDDDEPIRLADDPLELYPDDDAVCETGESPEQDEAGAAARDEGASGRARGASEWRLDPVKYRTLSRIGRNLTEDAFEGRINSVVGRTIELNQVVDILCKLDSNNPLLIGEPGVGKTALVEGLAVKIVDPDNPVPPLRNKIIISISTADLVAGTAMRGSFAERLQAIKKEVAASEGRIILFIDEIHTIIGTGVGDGGSDAANDLKGDLARGRLPCIGATTYAEYKRTIQTDGALERRFQRVTMKEPTVDEAEVILAGVASRYESHHHVKYTSDALRAAVRLTDRLIPDRGLPSKAIDLLDRAGARVRRDRRTEVGRDDITEVLATLLNLPVEFLDTSSARRVASMQASLKSAVFGCDGNISHIVTAIAANWARFGTRKPLGSFIFAGPPATGKMTLARELSRVMYGSDKSILEIDLADFSEQHSLSNLIGAPAGFVGYEDGGLLADALLRTPFLTVVWHNSHQAHPSVLAQVSNIVREGSITNRLGRRLDFRNSLQILTCELPEVFGSSSRGVGFARKSASQESDELVQAVKKQLSTELVREFDRVLLFSEPDQATASLIARRVLENAVRNFRDEHGVGLVPDASATDALAGIVLGTREPGLNERIARSILRPATDFLVENDLPTGASITVAYADGLFVFKAGR